MLSVRFWGVRGSIPCPGPDTVVYGGNTSCLEIRADDRLIIIDLGTGVRPLGDFLVKNDLEKHGKVKADIFITHTHWDHIMGFPMFAPIYIPGTELHITAPLSIGKDSLKTIIETQLSYQYWPVKADELAASISYNQIEEITLDLGGGVTVTSKYLNHPIYCLGYRVNYQGKSIATVYDHEQYSNSFTIKPGEKGYIEDVANMGELSASEENEKVRQFIKDADIVVHDAQYSQEEYASHSGWGHCSHEGTVSAALGLNIKTLVLFHHEPSHDDSNMDCVALKYADSREPKVIVAKEGMLLEA